MTVTGTKITASLCDANNRFAGGELIASEAIIQSIVLNRVTSSRYRLGC